MKNKHLQNKSLLLSVLLVLLQCAVGMMTANAQNNAPVGAINGLFTVNANGSQVFFSQGNLQFIGSAETPYWKFADNQWDYLGTTTGQNSSDSNVDRDLFGWSTSGYNHGAVCYQPWSTSTSYSEYYAYGNNTYNLCDQTGKADWGYNAISNGGNQENNGWRTLTTDEWQYVFNTRSTASGIRYAKANVNNVNGVILLPDDWSADSYTLNNTNTGDASFTSNTIPLAQWNVFEQHGAVFLPAAGRRDGTSVNYVGSDGNYWSASYISNSLSFIVSFYGSSLYASFSSYRYNGLSVRLVRPAQNNLFGISASPYPAEGGEVSGGGAYQEGTDCTLTATASAGYTFVNWTENGTEVSTNATYTFTVTDNKTLVANFISSSNDQIVEINDGSTANNQYLPSYSYFEYSLTQQIYTADEIGMAGTINSIAFKNTGAVKTRTYNIYMLLTSKETIKSSTDWVTMSNSNLVFEGEITFAVDEWTTIYLDTPFAYDGTSNLLVGVADVTGSYTNLPHMACLAFDATAQAIRAYRSTEAYDITSPGVNGTVMNTKNQIQLGILTSSGTICENLSSLDVSNVTGSQASLAWTGGSGCYNFEYKKKGASDWTSILLNSTQLNYTLTGLDEYTTYLARVQSVCENAVSGWKTVFFTTSACVPENQCELVFELTDSYGDGWTGCAIQVVDVASGGIVGTVTNENLNGTQGSGENELNTKYISVCTGHEVAFVWVKGSYPENASWVIYDNYGEVIVSGEANSSMATGDVIATHVLNCCPEPTDLTVDDVQIHQATLSWTNGGEENSWTIAYSTDGNFDPNEAELFVNVNSNPGIIQVEPDQTYYAYVRATCFEDNYSEWSNMVTFTTPETCPKPTDFAASDIMPTSAVLSWNSDNGAELEYAVVPAESKSDRSPWLYYDNGTYDYSIGTGGSTLYWGVMFPADMLTNNAVTKVSIYERSDGNNDNPITIYIYSGGDDAPETLLYEETVETEAANDFHEVTLAEPVTIDMTQNLWIVLKEYGSYPAMGCEDTGDPNGRWISLDGTDWADVAGYDLNYTWMVRAYLDASFDPDDLEWIVVTAPYTTPYTLTGLDPETTYAVRVRANCGGDGYSNWAYDTFVTRSACENPKNLKVKALATQANVTWIGYQEMYNLRYRIPVQYEAFFYEDFDSAENYALPEGWTSIDNDGDGNDWYVWNNESYAHDGTGLVTSASYDITLGVVLTPDNWLITPQIELQGTMRVWLRACDPGYPQEHYAIYLSTTGNTVEDFDVTLVEESYDLTGEYVEITADLSEYAGQLGYIAIRHFNCTDMYRLNVDDFGLFGDPIAGTGEWIEIQTSEPSALLDDLEPETTYEVQVQGVCPETETTDWTDIAIFTTVSSCEPISNFEVTEVSDNSAIIAWTGYQSSYNIRYRISEVEVTSFFEDFEGLSDGALPNGWTSIDADGDGNDWYSQSGYADYAHSGEGIVSSASYIYPKALTPDNWLITPQIELQGTMKVWMLGQDPKWPQEHYAIYLSTTGNAVEDFDVTLVEESYDLTDKYVKITADLRQYAGQRGYIAIRHFNCSDLLRLNVDDFGIYTGEVIPAGEWITATSNEELFTMENLASETTYKVQVQGVCPDNAVTEWTDTITFTTLESPIEILVTSNPSNGGTVTGSNTYNHGSTATLTATANTGYTFVNWTENGNEVSTDAVYSFTVTSSRTLVANFVLNSCAIAVTANPSAGGTITGAGILEYGATATLTATPAMGYTFVNWTENGEVVSTNVTYSFTVTNNRALVANFNPDSYSITVSANPSYGGSVTGGNTYNHGSTATLTATANLGYSFVNWTENGVVVSTNATYSFTITGARTIVANFSVNSHVVTAVANPNDGGMITGANTYNYGSIATLEATANTGYTFLNWTENGEVVYTNATYSFTVTNNRALVAHFNPNCYSITVVANSSNGGTVTGTNTYNYGSTATLSATANPGYSFVNWTENGEVVSTSTTYSFSVTGNRTLVANFSLNSYTVTVLANPNVGGTITGANTYNYGSTATLTATANTGYTFDSWMENEEIISTNTTYTFTVTGDRTLVANFTETITPVSNHWIPENGSFEDNMTFTAVIQIDGEEQHSDQLEVGAFSGEQCRGSQIASLFEPTQRHLVQLTIFGENGDELTFKLYDHAIEQELDYNSPASVNFNSSGYGSLANPYVLNFTSSITQAQNLTEGWNWWSTYVEMNANDGLAQLENSLGDNGLIIKSRNDGYVEPFEYNGTLTWYGTLNGLCNEQSYKINTLNACEASVTGFKADPANHLITINSGWNWIGFPSQQSVSVSTALSGFNPEPDDIIKGRNSYASFYSANGYHQWYGTLNSLEPG